MPQVERDGVILSYESSGEGTALVLLHGLGGDRHVWDEDVAVFATRHRVVQPDLRGFGESAKPAGPYSTEMFAADLLALLDACEIDKAHVLGISMGGVVAQRFALDFPQRVRSLILVSTSSEVGPQATAAWQRLADRIESRGFDERSADASRSVSPRFAARHPEIVAELGRRNAACEPRAYAAAARAVSSYHFTTELGRLVAPVLILQGLDDQLTPPGGAVKMNRALRHSRLLMIPEAGHNLPLEQPEIFRHAVLGFVAGVDLTEAVHAEPDR
jgi:pimeloyl-ACP methyl ester carboxylesterase